MARFKSTQPRKRQQQRLSRLKRQAKEFGITLPDEISTRKLKTNQIKGLATSIQKDVNRFKRETLKGEDNLFIFESILLLFDVLADLNRYAYNSLSEKIQKMSKVQIINGYKRLLNFVPEYEIADDSFVFLDKRGYSKVDRFHSQEFNKLVRG